MSQLAMKSTFFVKATVLLVVCLIMSSATYLSAVENDDIRNIAERFVCQVAERDTNAIFQSYLMSDEFRAGMPNTDTVIGWASGIDRLFGRLGDVKESEIVEHHDLGLRSVYLYYQGRKRPAKIWVTFSGTTIAGFHYNLWEEGVAKREPTFLIKLAEHPLTWWIGSILGIVAIIFLFCYGAYRHNYDWGQSCDP